MKNQDDNPLYQLLKIVDVLSQEHTVIVDDAQGAFLGSRQEKPLLIKLRRAVASSIGRGDGVGKAHRERVPLNVGAADLYRGIEREIRGWHTREARMLGDRVADHGRAAAEVVLRQWYLLYAGRFRSGRSTDAEIWDRIRVVESWVTRITDLLDPPFRFPLAAACPECKAEWVTVFETDDPGEVERVRALNVIERENVEESTVVCSSCDTVWRGLSGARALRIAIDDAEAAALAG